MAELLKARPTPRNRTVQLTEVGRSTVVTEGGRDTKELCLLCRDKFYKMKTILGVDANGVNVFNATKLYILKWLIKKEEEEMK